MTEKQSKKLKDGQRVYYVRPGWLRFHESVILETPETSPASLKKFYIWTKQYKMLAGFQNLFATKAEAQNIVKKNMLRHCKQLLKSNKFLQNQIKSNIKYVKSQKKKLKLMGL